MPPGSPPNSEVKYAGAHAGRVKEVRLISREDQTQDPKTELFNCVEVVVEVDNKHRDRQGRRRDDQAGRLRHLGQVCPAHARARPRQQGARRRIDVVQGEMPFDLSDLIQPAGDALEQAKMLLTKLQPVMDRLDVLSQKMSTSLPPLMDHADKFLQDGDGVICEFQFPGGPRAAQRDARQPARLHGKSESRQHQRQGAHRDAGGKTVARFLGRPDGQAASGRRHLEIEPGDPPQAQCRRECRNVFHARRQPLNS